MELIENTLEREVAEFLAQPPFCFIAQPPFCFIAQHSPDGPRVSPLWFLWEEEAIWNVARVRGRSYPDRVDQYPQTAVAIVDFDPGAGRVEHVGMRGRATLEPYDGEQADRLFRKYLSESKDEWPEMFVGIDTDTYRLIKFEPETVVARDQSYPAPTGGET